MISLFGMPTMRMEPMLTLLAVQAVVTLEIYLSFWNIFYANFQLAMNTTIDYAHQSFTNLPEFFRSVSFPDSEGTKQQNVVIMQCNRRMQVKGEGKESAVIYISA